MYPDVTDVTDVYHGFTDGFTDPFNEPPASPGNSRRSAIEITMMVQGVNRTEATRYIDALFMQASTCAEARMLSYGFRP